MNKFFNLSKEYFKKRNVKSSNFFLKYLKDFRSLKKKYCSNHLHQKFYEK